MDAEEIAILEEFLTEGYDLLDEIEPKLIQFQQAYNLPAEAKKESLNAIFRVFHSMKGTAGILPLPNIALLVHTAESLLALFRKGKAAYRSEHTAVFLQAIDLLRKLFRQVGAEKHDRGFEEPVNRLCGDLKAIIQSVTETNAGNSVPAPPAPEQPGPPPASGAASAAIPPAELPALESLITPEMTRKFTDEADELLEQVEQHLLGLDRENGPEHLHAAFRCLHSFKGNCGYMGLEDMGRLSHGLESILETVNGRRLKLAPEHISLVLKLVDALRSAVADLSRGGKGAVAAHKDDLNQLVEVLLPQASQNGQPTADKPAAAPQPAAAAPARQDIRVGLGKLDALINLVGELVIAEAMVTTHPAVVGLKDHGVEQVIHQLRRVSQELQDVALSVRMVPLTATFQKMIRLVHDLSIKSGKAVELKLQGGETEVDKNVSELIADPLVHIVRNAVDHGLETPDERERLSKPRTGCVTIKARHESGEVWISISDDGRGLIRDKLLQKGRERGLVAGDGSGLSDAQVNKLIFEPGFSTAEKITDISGRGVGLDVVKKNVEKMKGRIEIQSKPGQGTTFLLRIPLTLAIIEGMLVRVGDTRYTIPLLAIRESFRPRPDQINVLPEGGEIARVRDRFYPIVRLHELFRRPHAATRPEDGILVLVQAERQRACLLVDEILGQQETVIKGLSNYLGAPRGISGCTILGDGEISLLLDVGLLMQFTDQTRPGTVAAAAAKPV